MSASDWKICARTHDRLGESILWHPEEQALYWIDFYGPTVHRMRKVPGGAVESWTIGAGKMIGSLVFADQGRLVLALDRSLHVFSPATGETAFFADPRRGDESVAYNDGKIDRAGRYWIGTYDLAETKPIAAFYRMSREGSETLGDSGFIVCNGPTFSPDNRILYFSDSAGRRVLAYDVGRTGDLSGRRVLRQFTAEEGMPDGLAADSRGNIWCALYGGGKIVCLDPQGETLRALDVPTPNVTSLCFGGTELKDLYVTTGWIAGTTEADKKEYIGGCVFVRPVDHAGLPEPIFSLGNFPSPVTKENHA